ncbi:YopX family protein [Sutcliffiella cohnii]
MREIKFRVYDKSLKKVHVVGTNQHDSITCFDGEIKYYNLQNGEGSGEHGDYVLMQYTGLKDKNGTEIYEGDILSTDLLRPYLIVEYRIGAFMYQCHDNGQDFYDFMLPTDADNNQDKYSIVIGNIYENPELLKK